MLEQNDEKVLFDFIYLWESFFNNILGYNDLRLFRFIEKQENLGRDFKHDVCDFTRQKLILIPHFSNIPKSTLS